MHLYDARSIKIDSGMINVMVCGELLIFFKLSGYFSNKGNKKLAESIIGKTGM